MKQWEGRVVLVTGASTGIGAAICKELVKHNMEVVGCAKDTSKILEIANSAEVTNASGHLHAIKCDLSVEEQIRDMFKEIGTKYGGVDVCINNAVFGKDSSLVTGETDDWKRMLDVNVLGLCVCTREAVQQMKKKNAANGLVIHMGCVMGHKVPEFPPNTVNPPALGFYYGCKFMLRGLAESLRQEFKRDNSTIRVSTISPGAVKTEFFGSAFNEKAAEEFYSAVECLRPEDVAEAVVSVLNTPPQVNVQDITVQPMAFLM